MGRICPSQVENSENKIAIHEIDALLGEDGAANIVEITGVGGLGKTTAAREYMKRCIEGDYRKEHPYAYYFYYTAKGEQGEIETTFGKRKFILPLVGNRVEEEIMLKL